MAQTGDQLVPQLDHNVSDVMRQFGSFGHGGEKLGILKSGAPTIGTCDTYNGSMH